MWFGQGLLKSDTILESPLGSVRTLSTPRNGNGTGPDQTGSEGSNVLIVGKLWLSERSLFCLPIPAWFRCSMGTTFKPVQPPPKPVPTRFLLTRPKIKNMWFGQGFQNPPNSSRKKSAQLGPGQLPVRRPDQTPLGTWYRTGEDRKGK